MQAPTMSFEDLQTHGHSDIVSLVSTEVVLGRVQHPITDFTGPWDNFTVHSVTKQPLTLA